MRFTLKNMPKLRLADLLRRRKMTLKQFLNEFGITTYEGLASRCERMGVVPPPGHEFLATALTVVNNPSEGIVVVELPVVVHDDVAEVADDQTDLVPVGEDPQVTSDPSQKKPRKKKEAPQAQ